MNKKLTSIIERLYETFAKYEGKSTLEGSPVYDDVHNWNKELRSKNLRDLTDEDLSRFAGKVLLTWGDEDDFRYYLPRILELTAELKIPYDVYSLYRRLEDAKWYNWDIEEQAAINDFTIEMWNNLLNDNSEKAEWEFKEYFHAIANFYKNFSEVLHVWEENTSSASIRHLTNYIFEERHNIFDNSFINSIDKNTKHIEEFKSWLTSDKILKKMEIAFYESDNNEFSKRLSWLEQILNQEKKYST
jgi:hypothetical protein